MDAVAQDVRQTLSSTDVTVPDPGILLDYVDRVSEEMLRNSKWMFLQGPPQLFVTQLGVTDYWVGPTQTGPLTAYDTKLNLTDFRVIKPKTVVDRSNFQTLGHLDEAPVSARLAFSDTLSRPGRPTSWRQDESTPEILNIYPAPDNQNTYTPVPDSPITSRLLSGSLPGRIYFVALTYTDTLGNESTPSNPSKLFVPANSALVVNPPVEPIAAGTSGVLYDRYNVYAAEAQFGVNLDVTDLVLQTTGLEGESGALVPTTSTWTEALTGLVTTGPNPPSENNLMPLDGYVIEFRYFKLRLQVTNPNQVLQVPDDYRDVVIAGVNAVTFMYLSRPTEASRWYSLYKDGLSQIVRDINFISRGGEYIQPDATSVGNYLPTVETLDLGQLSN